METAVMINNIGTVEPRYNDLKVILDFERTIVDDDIAFIYGAIKKYGYKESYILSLKKYIKEIINKS